MLGVALLLLAGLGTAGCGSGTESELREVRAAAHARFAAQDWSGVLALARGALDRLGGDAELESLAALACLRLDRRSEALTLADTALARDGLSAELQAHLSWARGAALMQRFRELQSLDDWRLANQALEGGTLAGDYRVESATALVALQTMSGLGDTERMLRFARLVRELAPASESDRQVTALLERQGVSR